MSRLRRPLVWLPLVYLALVVGGAIGLAQPFATNESERERKAYFVRHAWNSAFDALSATCGVGLLVRNFDQDFTDNGRRILVALAFVGTISLLIASMQLLREFAGPAWPLPPTWLVVLLLLLFQAFPIGIACFNAAGGGTPLFSELVGLHAVAAFNGLGWPLSVPQAEAWVLALIGLIGALGWPIWVLIAWPIAKRCFDIGRLRAALLSYFTFLLLACLILTLSESQRGFGQRSISGATLADQSFFERFRRCTLQTLSAAGVGRPTEPLTQGGVSEAGKLVLAAVVLLGGFVGPPAGGIGWGILLMALLGTTTKRRNTIPARAEHMNQQPPTEMTGAGVALVAGRIVILISAAALLVAVGLLLIETRVASRFQSAPTLGDAALDAASLVGGANLTSGLARTISDPNLSSGMFQNVDLYQYGMGFMALAMIVGRFLPLVILARHARSISGGRVPATSAA